MPAAFCGVYSFKPTQSRVARRGIATGRRNKYNMFNHLRPVVGPLGHSVEDLIVGMKIQCDEEAYLIDPSATPCPWRNDQYLSVLEKKDRSKTKIGMLKPSDELPVSASVERAMKISEQFLKA